MAGWLVSGLVVCYWLIGGLVGGLVGGWLVRCLLLISLLLYYFISFKFISIFVNEKIIPIPIRTCANDRDAKDGGIYFDSANIRFF